MKGIISRKRIFATYKGKKYKAIVQSNGRIKFDGALYDSPSGAAQAVRKRPTNGWRFWHVRKGGKLVALRDLRE